MGSSSVEWFASSIGAVFAGYEVVLVTELVTNVFTIIRGVSTGIHATSTSEVCQYILKDCKAHIVVVENAKLLDTIVEVSMCHVYTSCYCTVCSVCVCM